MLPRALWLALLGVVVVLVFGWVEPGPISIDEVTYRRMTHDLLAGHGLTLSNGYAELPSPELMTQFVRANARGELVAQYPYGGALLALPAFATLGARGMFLVNALAYALAIWLCFRIANQLLRDRTTALLGSGFLAATFFTEYALASWPHASSVAAMLGAFSLTVTARERDTVGHAAMAGIVVGFAATLRLDALFIVPVLAAPLFFASPTRLRPLLALAAGLIPGLALMSVTNYLRWDSLSPLSYGPAGPAQVAKFAGFAIAAVVVAALAWFASRPRALDRLRRHAKPIAFGLLALVLVALVVPPGQKLVRGVLALAVDLRLRPGSSEPLLYFSGFKRALLQTAPFLVLAMVPLVRASEKRWELRWLAALPALLLAFYGSSAWHGGLALNMRYLLPALPLLCILVAYGLRELVAGARVWPAAAAAGAAAVAYMIALPSAFSAREHFVLTLPLVLAVVAVAAVIAWLRRPGLAPVARIVVGVALGWSAAATVHDAMWSRDVRAWNHRVATQVEPHIAPGALLFGDIPDPFYELSERIPDLRIAVFTHDIDDAGRLIRHELGRGRKIFAVVSARTWETLQRIGALRDTRVEPIGVIGPYRFGQIHALQAP